jgi:hypothetical protein
MKLSFHFGLSVMAPYVGSGVSSQLGQAEEVVCKN